MLRALAFALLVTALADPARFDSVALERDRGYEISLILDASGSMEISNKFKIVKKIIEEFIQQRKHDKIGLTIFGDFAYVAVPLTYDKSSLLRLLDKIEVGIAGTHTALYEALFISTKLFYKSKAKNKIAILLTDGMESVGSVPLRVAVETAKKYGIRVYTIGVGSVGDYDPFVLEKIARQTGGKFFKADSAAKLAEVYQTIDRLEKSEITGERYVRVTHYFPWPLGAGTALLFWLLFEGAVRARRRV
ncbi:MAG: VWA domain-containing protein [Epsilonproteobacteria bacterium]|nr:VWA domain-containing protein [Campylobacterota bacterium]